MKHKPRIKRRLGVDVDVNVVVSVQVGEDIPDSNINEVGEDILPDSNINVFDDNDSSNGNGNNKLQSFSSPSDENLSTINDIVVVSVQVGEDILPDSNINVC